MCVFSVSSEQKSSLSIEGVVVAENAAGVKEPVCVDRGCQVCIFMLLDSTLFNEDGELGQS